MATISRATPTAFRLVRVAHEGFPTLTAAPRPAIDFPARYTPYPLKIPRNLPLPALPPDNPLIRERVELGRRLFEDPLLSRNGALACTSCHQQTSAFSDSRTFSPGVDGKHGDRHSMPLFNLAWKDRFFWDGRAASLREQALHPIQDPLEMNQRLPELMQKLRRHDAYPELFKAAFASGEISATNVSLAIESFILTMTSFDSAFDRAQQGKEKLSDDATRGFALFFTEFEPRMGKRGADCFHCHGGAFFTDHQFHNNGLRDSTDSGLQRTTLKPEDAGKFSTPSLRNVGITAPYMHDGRFQTLEEVLRHYSEGVHLSPTLDPNLAKHGGNLALSTNDIRDLVAFLQSLTDTKTLASSIRE